MNSLAFKVVVFVALISMVFTAALGFFNFELLEKSFDKMRAEQGALLAESALPKIATMMRKNSEKRFDGIAEELLRHEEVTAVRIEDIAHQKRYDYPSSVLPPQPSDTRVLEDIVDPKTAAVTGRLEIALADSAAVADSGWYSPYVETVAPGIGPILGKLRPYYPFLGMILAGYAALLMVLAIFVYWTLRPLGKLASEMASFDLNEPAVFSLKRKGKGEVGLIVNTVNTIINNHTMFINQSHLQEAQKMAHLGSWQFAPEDGTLIFSEEMYNITGINNQGGELTWDAFSQLVESKDRDYFVKTVTNAIANRSQFRIMHDIVNKSGEKLHLLSQGRVHKSNGGKLLLTGISMDVTEQTQNQRMIEKLAFYDPLTKLPNRLLFRDRLLKTMTDAKRRDEKVALLYLDLDRFKLINDSFGHTVGDLLLQEVANRLKSTLREVDTISRIGGDEFIIIAPMLKKREDVAVIAKKLTGVMQERWHISDKAFYTTTSIGISIYPDHAQDADGLVKFADTAMYKAKELGRNKWQCYELSMGEYVDEQLQLENDMRDALKTMEQFELYYQPKVALQGGVVVGAEVLLRWNHPRLGFVGPDRFIPIAENTGMIIEIGAWVLQESARQIKRWIKEGVKPVRLAINLSGRQFQSSSLFSMVKKTLNDYGIDASHIEFEVTESVSMSNLQESLRVLHELKSLGVGIVIDDFGTGYSSLAYLKQFPVDTLKIDKAFILNMLEDKDDRTIVETIVSMSSAMNLKVVAEGVEKIEHIHLLKKLKVDYVQGFYLSRPVPIDQFNTIYKKNREAVAKRMAAQAV
jgi:diguanylate cyclase (GGDEF)-like protein